MTHSPVPVLRFLIVMGRTVQGHWFRVLHLRVKESTYYWYLIRSLGCFSLAIHLDRHNTWKRWTSWMFSMILDSDLAFKSSRHAILPYIIASSLLVKHCIKGFIVLVWKSFLLTLLWVAVTTKCSWLNLCCRILAIVHQQPCRLVLGCVPPLLFLHVFSKGIASHCWCLFLHSWVDKICLHAMLLALIYFIRCVIVQEHSYGR